MQSVVNGVLMPPELDRASRDEQESYAADVRTTNRAFCDAYFALEDQAHALGLTMEDLDS